MYIYKAGICYKENNLVDLSLQEHSLGSHPFIVIDPPFTLYRLIIFVLIPSKRIILALAVYLQTMDRKKRP